MTNVRSVLAIALCILLGVSGQGMAFALGQAPAQDRMIICNGHLSKTVYVDSEGQPTSPPQHCTDCLHHLCVISAQSPVLTRAIVLEGTIVPSPYVPQAGHNFAANYAARAPPIL